MNYIAKYGLIDRDGAPVKKTKASHPYSYDGFVQWRGGDNSEVTGSVYTDRLYQFDYKKYNELCIKHFGNEGDYWGNRNPKRIEEFLRDWFEKPELEIVLISEYCNQATGYPVWLLEYKE
jgi:hypothetical protein